MCAGQVGPVDGRDRRACGRAPDDPVVVEHGLAVGGEPDVALQAGGAEPEGEGEGLDRVLRGVGPGAPVGERRSVGSTSDGRRVGTRAMLAAERHRSTVVRPRDSSELPQV